MKILLITALFSILFTMGCKHTPEERSIDHMKLDAPLRTKLAEMERHEDQSHLQCFVEFDDTIDSDTREKLENTGLKIMSIVDNIAVVEGDPESIQQCTKLEGVRSISLSITRPPLQ